MTAVSPKGCPLVSKQDEISGSLNSGLGATMNAADIPTCLSGMQRAPHRSTLTGELSDDGKNWISFRESHQRTAE